MIFGVFLRFFFFSSGFSNGFVYVFFFYYYFKWFCPMVLVIGFFV